MFHTGPRLVVLAVLVLGSLALAGCHEAVDEAGPEWRLSGSFTEETTQEDLDALVAMLEPYGATMAVLESFPLQFQITGPDPDDCPEVREMLLDHERVAEVRECESVLEA
jgi:hypothetical protein